MLNNPKETGKRLRKQRLLLNYSKEQLAELVHLSPRYIYDLEIGMKKMSLAAACRFREVLHISLDQLLFGEENKSFGEAQIQLLNECPEDKQEQCLHILALFIQSIKE